MQIWGKDNLRNVPFLLKQTTSKQSSINLTDNHKKKEEQMDLKTNTKITMKLKNISLPVLAYEFVWKQK